MFATFTSPVYADTGFGAFRSDPSPPEGHVHDTLEVSAFEGGSATMLYGGRAMTVEPDRLVVHWGMLPHQVRERAPGTRVVGVHVPLPWMLEWHLPGRLMAHILGMRLLVEPVRTSPCGDLEILRDWHRLVTEDAPRAADIVLLELRARLLRMEVPEDAAADGGRAIRLSSQAPFSRALHYIMEHYSEPLQMAAVARIAGIGSRHLTRIFRAHTGYSVIEYVMRLRIAHAQRLLATTDMKVIDVMESSGFSCATQFYAKFRDCVGCSPRDYATRSASRPSQALGRARE